MTLGMMASDVEQRVDFEAMRKYRLARAREQMEKYNLGALLCFDQDNIRYITNTHLAEWARGKYFRWCLLPRGGEPILFEVGTAAVVKRELCPWLEPANIRPAMTWNRGANVRAVNEELSELEAGLVAAERVLKTDGRLCVVTFHSLEDRIVKTFLAVRAGRTPAGSRHAPPRQVQAQPSFQLLFSGAQAPSAAEVAANPRARSAKLRAAVRTSAPVWREAA